MRDIFASNRPRLSFVSWIFRSSLGQTSCLHSIPLQVLRLKRFLYEIMRTSVFVYATSRILYSKTGERFIHCPRCLLIFRGRFYILQDYRLGFRAQYIDFVFSSLGKYFSLISEKVLRCLKLITHKFCACTRGKANVCKLKTHLFASVFEPLNRLLQNVFYLK